MYLVAYHLHCFQVGTSHIVSAIQVEHEFDLSLTVQDLRPEGTYLDEHLVKRDLVRGVYSAYCDVTYRKALALRTGTPQYGALYHNNYPNLHPAADLPDRIGAFGAFFSGDYFGGAGVDPVEVVRIRMKAQLPDGVPSSTAMFRCDFSKLLRPAFNTLVFGNWAASPPETGYVAPEQVTAGYAPLLIQR